MKSELDRQANQATIGLLIGMMGIALIVLACGAGAPGKAATGGDTNYAGQWFYAKGPNGEKCLFYEYGDRVQNNHALAMDCDTVNWEE